MLHGYGARTVPCEGVDEPISLKSLAVRSEGKTVLLVTADMIGIHTRDVEELEKLLRRETGIGFPDVAFCCSHTHFAPSIGADNFQDPKIGLIEADTEYRQFFEERLVEAVKESLATLATVEARVLRVPVPGAAFNRRTVKDDGSVATNFMYPLDTTGLSISEIDEELVALRFSDGEGTRAVLVNYGCHPVTGGAERETSMNKVSADYPFYLRRTIEAAWSCPVFFTLGCAGDVVPRDRYGVSRRRIGGILGSTVVLGDRLFRGEQSAPAGVHSAMGELSLESNLESERFLPPSEAAAEANTWLLLRQRLYPEGRVPIRLQTMRLGPITLVTMPFEVLSEIGRRLKEKYPDVVVASCSNGYQGYLSFEYEHERGGYEVSEPATHVAPGEAEKVFETLDRMLAAREA